MQEKIQDILQSAKGWLTASEIAERGNWRSAQHVGLALKQMADVSHRSSPTKKMHNGMPAKEYKLSYRVFEGDAVAPTIAVDATAPAVKDPLTTQPAAPVVRNSRTTEMPTDKECCNAAKDAVIEKLTKRLASTNIIIEVVCATHPDSACAKYELAENMNALSIPTDSTQILDEVRRAERERVYQVADNAYATEHVLLAIRAME